MSKEVLIAELRQKIIATLHLDGITEVELAADTQLFSPEGLGLDSVDALELVIMLEKDYAINIEDQASVKDKFSSLNSLAEFILSAQK